MSERTSQKERSNLRESHSTGQLRKEVTRASAKIVLSRRLGFLASRLTLRQKNAVASTLMGKTSVFRVNQTCWDEKSQGRVG